MPPYLTSIKWSKIVFHRITSGQSGLISIQPLRNNLALRYLIPDQTPTSTFGLETESPILQESMDGTQEENATPTQDYVCVD